MLSNLYPTGGRHAWIKVKIDLVNTGVIIGKNTPTNTPIFLYRVDPDTLSFKGKPLKGLEH